VLLRIAMTDEHAGWAIAKTTGDFAILHTSDSGTHWKNVSPPSFSPAQHGDAVYADEQGIDLSTLGNDAWVARVYGLQDSPQLFVWHTADGGAHWSASKIPVSDTYGLFLQFVDSQHGFLLGTSDAAMGHTAKRFYRTSDGGKTWRLVSDGFPTHPTKGALPFAGFPTGIGFRDSETGWVGMSPRGDTDVTLYRTKDDGATWQQQSVPIPAKFHSGSYDSDTRPPFFFDAITGVLPMQLILNNWSGLAVSTTDDGGATWQLTKIISAGSDTTASADSAFCFTTDGFGWVPVNNSLYVSRDFGRTWNVIKPNQALGRSDGETQLDFIDSQLGWALIGHTDGQSGRVSSKLLETRDGGYHWQLIYSSPAYAAKKAGK
jgi:photosystem II stability/assembly factor-like uncharacterized protein